MKMGYVLGGVIVVAGVAAFVASGGQQTTATAETPVASAARADEESPGGAQPVDSLQMNMDKGGYIVAGEVLETMDAGGYTYMRVGKPGTDGEWVAVSATKVEKGQQVSVRADTLMQNFQSPTLKRTFEKIRFGSMAGGAQAGAYQPGAPMPSGHPPMGGAPEMGGGHPPTGPGAGAGTVSGVKVDKVDKADGPNGRTISEIFAQKAALSGKTVRVRGTVIKLNSGILGKNFAHLRDGSGSDTKKDNDLTITTTDTFAMGDTILVEGQIELDTDIGAGYKYDVLLKDAKVIK